MSREDRELLKTVYYTNRKIEALYEDVKNVCIRVKDLIEYTDPKDYSKVLDYVVDCLEYFLEKLVEIRMELFENLKKIREEVIRV
jgi:hypothetical protein